MKISLIPTNCSSVLNVIKSGEVLNIDSTDYDFGPLPAGATLPSEALNCRWIAGPVERDHEGVLHLTLILPIQRAVFHDTLPDIVDPPDGVIELPAIKEDDPATEPKA